MIVRPAPLRPAELALGFRDRQVVDTRMSRAHQAALVELPVLVAIRTIPLPAIVMPFIGKANRDAVVAEGPELLDQAVLQLACPLALEERDDGLAPLDELRPVAPAAVRRIGER